jgi:hypothetical protein
LIHPTEHVVFLLQPIMVAPVHAHSCQDNTHCVWTHCTPGGDAAHARKDQKKIKKRSMISFSCANLHTSTEPGGRTFRGACVAAVDLLPGQDGEPCDLSAIS